MGLRSFCYLLPKHAKIFYLRGFGIAPCFSRPSFSLFPFGGIDKRIAQPAVTRIVAVDLVPALAHGES